MANLGYAEGRWLAPVWPGDTLRARSKVIGLKQNSNGKSGVVWVRTTGLNQHDDTVLDYVRWVMVRKRNVEADAPDTVIPELDKVVPADQLVVPSGLPSGTELARLSIKRLGGGQVFEENVLAGMLPVNGRGTVTFSFFNANPDRWRTPMILFSSATFATRVLSNSCARASSRSAKGSSR